MASGITLLLRSFRDDIARQRLRTTWRTLIMFSVVKLLIFAAVIALLWLTLSRAVPGPLRAPGVESPQNLISSAFETLFLLQMLDFYCAVFSIGPSSGSASASVYSRALLGAVAARDARLTQPVTMTPSTGASAEAEAPDAERTVGPLAHPMRTLGISGAAYALAALASAALLCGGVWLTIISLHAPPSFRQQTITLANWFAWLSFPLCMIVLAGGCAVWALVAWRFARMERTALTARVDAEGVTFERTGRRTQRLRWSDTRGLARFTFTDEQGRLHECFVLSAADEDVLWEALYASPGVSAAEMASEEAWRVAAHRLVEQVAQRAGLPLLDLSPTIAATLATTAGAPTSGAAWNLFARAHILARRQGDLALARELAQRPGQMGGLWPATLARFGGGAGAGLNKLTSAQREETLRLARELLPYVPTAAHVTPNPRKRLLIHGYWSSEFAFQALVIALALANIPLAIFWPFS